MDTDTLIRDYAAAIIAHGMDGYAAARQICKERGYGDDKTTIQQFFDEFRYHDDVIAEIKVIQENQKAPIPTKEEMMGHLWVTATHGYDAKERSEARKLLAEMQGFVGKNVKNENTVETPTNKVMVVSELGEDWERIAEKQQADLIKGD